MYDFTVPQGWQCPICKSVYSPNTSCCYVCYNKLGGSVTGDLTPNIKITVSDSTEKVDKKDLD